jgi:hypothetical protein
VEFRNYIESTQACSYQAIQFLTGLPTDQIERTLIQHGLNKHDGGINLSQLTLALDDLGIPWDIKLTKIARGRFPRQVQLPGKNILVMKNHVIASDNGQLHNVAGYHEEPILAVVSLNKA